ncbi:hypothetical protein GALMADRAFT_257256 [Galerina marginata CBS 339.88]|uniref:Uncharacterized protein n=1 Tax=Galerina marginata (strain CBS 339.88) TaxID=685588 RepID=A0A067SKJ8_GALM3|nr:hypothetical protein GALMADRAFT_257256 [Galerina marginata CBS 339.88]
MALLLRIAVPHTSVSIPPFPAMARALVLAPATTSLNATSTPGISPYPRPFHPTVRKLRSGRNCRFTIL